MQHTLYTFRLHKNGVLLFLAGALLFTGLIFTAGFLLGRATVPAAPAPPPRAPAAAPPAAEPAPTSSPGA